MRSAEAIEQNIQFLIQTGKLTRTEAQIVLDMIIHFENQLDDLATRTISAMDSKLALYAAVIIGLTCTRYGRKVKETLVDAMEKRDRERGNL